MRADAFFEAARALPFGDLPAIVGDGGRRRRSHLMPTMRASDAAASCAAARDRNIAVELVVLSDGAGSHPGSRPLSAG